MKHESKAVVVTDGAFGKSLDELADLRAQLKAAKEDRAVLIVLLHRAVNRKKGWTTSANRFLSRLADEALPKDGGA